MAVGPPTEPNPKFGSVQRGVWESRQVAYRTGYTGRYVEHRLASGQTARVVRLSSRHTEEKSHPEGWLSKHSGGQSRN